MNYWLLKSDPETYDWNNLLADKKTEWTGVRNYAARLALRSMKKDDMCLFYHSGESKSCVGVAKIITEQYPDPTDKENEGWVCVDIAPVRPLKREVTLEEMKAKKELQQLPLVRIPRLSCMPVTEKEWSIIMKMSNA